MEHVGAVRPDAFDRRLQRQNGDKALERGTAAPTLLPGRPSILARLGKAMAQRQMPTLVTNPTDDLAFAAAATAALGDAHTTNELEAILRRDYPRAVVRARDLTGDPLVWYVYREGHWVRAMDRT